VIDGRRIGLEHQELTEEDLARTSSNLTWLERQLREELCQRGADRDLALSVGVRAAAPVFRRRRELEESVRALAQLAVERSPTVSREQPLELLASELFPLGIVGPEFVHISRTSGAALGPLATVSRGFWGPGGSAVVSAVRRKEELLPAYVANSSASEQWLLLVTGESYEQATDSVVTQWTRECRPTSTGFT
jgi:hypothetical protein